MFLHQSANLEWNLYFPCYPWHIHQGWKIEHWEEEYVYTHIQVAQLRFRNLKLPHCHRVVRVGIQVDVLSVLVSVVCIGPVEVHPFLRTTCVSVDCLLWYYGKKGSCQFEFHERWPGVVLLQPLPFYAQKSEHHASSLLGPWCEVSWSCILCSPSRRANTLLTPFWPYSRQGACQADLAVPDLLAMP